MAETHGLGGVDIRNRQYLLALCLSQGLVKRHDQQCLSPWGKPAQVHGADVDVCLAEQCSYGPHQSGAVNVVAEQEMPLCEVEVHPEVIDLYDVYVVIPDSP